MSIIFLKRKKEGLNFLALFNCACSPSNDRFLTKETCADEKRDQRVGETVSFASLVVLSFQYRNRKKKKKQETEGGEGVKRSIRRDKQKTATNNRETGGETERERATFFCYCYRLRDITMMHVCSRFSDCVYLQRKAQVSERGYVCVGDIKLVL